MNLPGTRLDSGNILDLVLASNPSLISTINTVAGMSDHEAILFDINMNPTRNNKPPHKVFSYRSADWESLKSNCTELTKHYFDRNPDNLDVNSNWDFFHQNYTKLMSQSIPSRMTKQKHHLPWITRSIIRLQRKRDKAHSQAKKTKRNKHWEKFKQLRKEVTKEVANSYSSYINNVIGESLTTNPKQFWSFIRKNKTENLGIPSLKVNDMVKTTDSDKADALNDYFKSVFTKEQLPIPTKGPSPFPSIQSLEIGLNGVTKQLQALNPNKASGPDEIPAKVLKETAIEISPIIHHIFQQSYTSGQLPEAWKTALVTAIYKKGNKSDPAYYRPISLTCILCKVMEHIVLSHMWKHLNRNNIILPDQHGFRSGLSCETQLVEAAHGWAASMNKRHQTDLILLDFSKAFDCVPHQRLLHIINYYGISGPTLYWIKSFLSDRTQHVSINGSHSALANVTSGVPQGSVLGPVLFLLYINDITNQIQSNIRLFADDSIVYREIRSPADHQILQTDIQMLTDWSKKWQMNFNTSKCHLLTITHKPKPSEFTYTISNQPISRVNSHPYLGVTIDAKLSWSKHIQGTASKSAKTLGLLKRTLYPAKPKVREAAYNMLVRPKLEYGSIAWSPHTQNNIDTLEKIHRSAARFVVHDHRRTTSVTHMQGKLGWQTLETRRLQHQLVFLYKIKYNLLNISLSQHLVVPCTRTRNSDPNKFVQIPTRINTYAYSFYPRVIRAWNLLPNEILRLSSIDTFHQAVSTVQLAPPAHLNRL